MKIKELREQIKEFDDDDDVLIEGKLSINNVSEISDENYLPTIKSGGQQLYECEPRGWDSTEKFKDAKRCCLITSEEYYIKLKGRC